MTMAITISKGFGPERNDPPSEQQNDPSVADFSSFLSVPVPIQQRDCPSSNRPTQDNRISGVDEKAPSKAESEEGGSQVRSPNSEPIRAESAFATKKPNAPQPARSTDVAGTFDPNVLPQPTRTKSINMMLATGEAAAGPAGDPVVLFTNAGILEQAAAPGTAAQIPFGAPETKNLFSRAAAAFKTITEVRTEDEAGQMKGEDPANKTKPNDSAAVTTKVDTTDATPANNPPADRVSSDRATAERKPIEEIVYELVDEHALSDPSPVDPSAAETIPEPAAAKLSTNFANANSNQPVTAQIAPLLAVLAQGIGNEKRNSMKMRLSPAELGSVEVTITRHTSGAVSASISAETDRAHQALNENLVQLRQSLEAAGVKVESIEIGCKPFSFTDQGEANRREAQTEFSRTASTDDASATPVAQDTGENIRLVSLRA